MDAIDERLLHESLTAMAADDGDPLARDLARDVLAGNVTLYQAAASSVYGEVFAQRAAEFTGWWHGLSEADRERLNAEGEQQVGR